ncbi:hypothetical protein ACFCV9_02665 [Streptomyces sp. NPDC056367]|uniref:hypothetical protein n=1 Tax=unclassified Streptomyces TaxID=2593676 RepID=UPI0035DE6492
MTAGPGPAGAVWHRIARDEGLAPALTALCAAVLPGRLPLGPHGHGAVSREMLLKAESAWYAGRPGPLDPGGPEVLRTEQLPGGELVMVRQEVPAGAEYGPGGAGTDWSAGLLWVRLGLSEALRERVVAHLTGRTTGDVPLIRQQLVKAAVADALVDHLEIRAVLTDAMPGELNPAAVEDLHRQLTATDRAQVKLLGASGYLADGPGQTGYVSELVAEAYAMAGRAEEPQLTRASAAGGRCW